jgi:hypothetical protein
MEAKDGCALIIAIQMEKCAVFSAQTATPVLAI